MFGFVGKRMFLALGCLAFVDFAWVAWAGHKISMLQLGQTLLPAGLLLVIARVAYARAGGEPTDMDMSARPSLMRQVAWFAEALSYMIVGWTVLRLFNHLGMTIPFAYADPLLITWEDALFPIWNEYFRFVAERDWMISALDLAYTSLTPVTVFAFAGLFFLGNFEKAKLFLLAMTVTGMICTSIGMFFPAKAAVYALLADQGLLQNFQTLPGWYHLDIMDTLRSGAPVTFDLGSLPGLTTFPSFHTGAGIVVAYCYFGTRLFWPVLAYTVCMIASTPVFGGHYFVDLAAGTFIALCVCVILERRYSAVRSEETARGINGSVSHVPV
jgi:membrane-associated phospholipid phosphatase